jgi:hypothetical protein
MPRIDARSCHRSYIYRTDFQLRASASMVSAVTLVPAAFFTGSFALFLAGAFTPAVARVGSTAATAVVFVVVGTDFLTVAGAFHRFGAAFAVDDPGVALVGRLKVRALVHRC